MPPNLISGFAVKGQGLAAGIVAIIYLLICHVGVRMCFRKSAMLQTIPTITTVLAESGTVAILPWQDTGCQAGVCTSEKHHGTGSQPSPRKGRVLLPREGCPSLLREEKNVPQRQVLNPWSPASASFLGGCGSFIWRK